MFPETESATEDFQKFSPRMRGCFLKAAKLRRVMEVLPAYAGMFLIREDGAAVFRQFSPRMRGCFQKDCLDRRLLEVLPAYAGMFLGVALERSTCKRSPRVCGDVSLKFRIENGKNLFSPRMRGCFSKAILCLSVSSVLPAYAGMFL